MGGIARARRSIAVLTLMLLASCRPSGDEDVVRLRATVVKEGRSYVLVADSSGMRYIPRHLPFSYRKDGLEVRATGRSYPVADASEGGIRRLEITSLVEGHGPEED